MHIAGTVVSVNGGVELVKDNLENSDSSSIVGYVEIDGALLHDKEPNGIDEEGTVKLLPYTLKLNGNGEVTVEIGLIKFEGISNSPRLLGYKYEEHVDGANTKTFTLVAYKAERSIISRGDSYFGVVGGVELGSESYELNKDGEEIKFSTSERLKAEGGFKFNYNFGKNNIFATTVYQKSFNNNSQEQEFPFKPGSTAGREGLTTTVGYSRSLTYDREFKIYYEGDYTSNEYINMSTGEVIDIQDKFQSPHNIRVQYNW